MNNTDISYRTAQHYSYVNTAVVTSDHNPHCTLTALHMTVGCAAISGIAFCDESSLTVINSELPILLAADSLIYTAINRLYNNDLLVLYARDF
jgi:hypothetical protein